MQYDYTVSRMVEHRIRFWYIAENTSGEISSETSVTHRILWGGSGFRCLNRASKDVQVVKPANGTETVH